MLFYILTTTNEIQGVIESNYIEIEHNLLDTDSFYCTIDFDYDKYQLLQKGRLIYSKVNKKAYRIHSVEANYNEIFIFAHSLEGVLNQRIFKTRYTFSGLLKNFLQNAINQGLNIGDASRKIPFRIVNESKSSQTVDVELFGDNVFETMMNYSKEYGVYFRTNYDFENAVPLVFTIFDGKDASINQNINPQIAWRSAWGDIFNTQYVSSTLGEKNYVLVHSGDETPIKLEITKSKKGWDLSETFVDASDIKKDMFEDTTLTTAQIQSFLKSRGNQELESNRAQDDLLFELSDAIDEKFLIDYNVGDIVSIVDSNFQLQKNNRITQVKETIVRNKSTIQISFAE